MCYANRYIQLQYSVLFLSARADGIRICEHNEQPIVKQFYDLFGASDLDPSGMASLRFSMMPFYTS